LPSKIIAKRGAKLELHCISLSNPIWWKIDSNNDVMLMKSARPTRYILKIYHADESKGGRYYCNGTKHNDVPFTSFVDVYIGS